MHSKRLLSLVLMIALMLAAFSAAAQVEEDELVLLTLDEPALSLAYPASLAENALVETVPATPYEEGMPYFAISPAYTQILFETYAGGIDFFHLPAIYIYPVAEIVEMPEEEFPVGFRYEYETLAEILNERPELAEIAPFDSSSIGGREGLPLLPVFNAAQVFKVHTQYLESESLSGIRYVTYYSQSVDPITDASIFYTFQGLTTDGRYYVAAILPVATGFFPALDEIDYNEFDYDAFANSYAAYLESSIFTLESFAPEDFNPTLPVLDALILSMDFEE